MAALRCWHQGINTAKTAKLYTVIGLENAILGRVQTRLEQSKNTKVCLILTLK